MPDYGEIGAAIDQRLRATVATVATVADMPQTGAAAGETLTPLLRELPLIAPMFAEQRLIILRVLEQWRQQGWLQEQAIVD